MSQKFAILKKNSILRNFDGMIVKVRTGIVKLLALFRHFIEFCIVRDSGGRWGVNSKTRLSAILDQAEPIIMSFKLQPEKNCFFLFDRITHLGTPCPPICIYKIGIRFVDHLRGKTEEKIQIEAR